MAKGLGAKQQDIEESSCVTNYRYATYYWSCALTAFALFCVLWGIGNQWNNPPWSQKGSHGALEIFLFLGMLCWISMLEGYQISLVGLQGINLAEYKESHPRAHRILTLCHKGPNVERFLVGRQFLLLFNGFLASRLGGAASEEFSIGSWDWISEPSQFFISNSIFLLIVILLFQLVSQLMAAEKMLDFLELPLAGYYTVLLPTLFVESIGLTHSTYMLKDGLAWAVGIDRSEEDPAKKMNKNFFYYLRCLISISAVLFAGTFLVKGWIMAQTAATSGAGWRFLPPAASVVVSVFFLFIMSCAEGLQVSALALQHENNAELATTAPKAYAITQILFKGRNMQAFLVGRQFFVALMMILLGRVTGYAGGGGALVCDGPDVGSGSGAVPCEGEDWGMGAGFNEWLLQTGFMGAVFVVNVAQLASQVTASIFPVGFINNRVLKWLLQIMLMVEASGLVNACWPVAWFLDEKLQLKKSPFEAENEDKVAATRRQSATDAGEVPGMEYTGIHVVG
jgi:hypothetical protein